MSNQIPCARCLSNAALRGRQECAPIDCGSRARDRQKDRQTETSFQWGRASWRKVYRLLASGDSCKHARLAGAIDGGGARAGWRARATLRPPAATSAVGRRPRHMARRLFARRAPGCARAPPPAGPKTPLALPIKCHCALRSCSLVAPDKPRKAGRTGSALVAAGRANDLHFTLGPSAPGADCSLGPRIRARRLGLRGARRLRKRHTTSAPMRSKWSAASRLRQQMPTAMPQQPKRAN